MFVNQLSCGAAAAHFINFKKRLGNNSVELMYPLRANSRKQKREQSSVCLSKQIFANQILVYPATDIKLINPEPQKYCTTQKIVPAFCPLRTERASLGCFFDDSSQNLSVTLAQLGLTVSLIPNLIRNCCKSDYRITLCYQIQGKKEYGDVLQLDPYLISLMQKRKEKSEIKFVSVLLQVLLITNVHVCLVKIT